MSQLSTEIELSIVMPCLNEAETIVACIKKAQLFLHNYQIQGEIVIADNGSTDGSQKMAEAHGARVVAVAEKGYGSALMGGIQAANGRYIIMGDADDSYDFSALQPFIEKLRQGYQLVMGNRFKGGIAPGAMPLLHKYLGNPVLSGIGRLFFHSPIRDFHCGLRGFERSAILALDLRTTGMEFASEMVVKATLHKLRICEVPTTLSPDGRSRPPHLRSWRDGWRHLRFLLMYSPRWLFFYPGLMFVFMGFLGMSVLLPGPLQLGSMTFDIHTLLLSNGLLVIGVQTLTFAHLSHQFAINMGLVPSDEGFIKRLEAIQLESLLIAGGIGTLLGLAGILYSIFAWGQMQFGPLQPEYMMRILVPSVTLLIMGFQLVFAAFFRSILQLKIQRYASNEID